MFQPIPLRNSIIPHYITLDASGVLSIFGDDGESHLGYKINENKEKENVFLCFGLIVGSEEDCEMFIYMYYFFMFISLIL